jgi:hypothetical protein
MVKPIVLAEPIPWQAGIRSDWRRAAPHRAAMRTVALKTLGGPVARRAKPLADMHALACGEIPSVWREVCARA